MLYSRDNQFHDLTGDDAYRAFLISRNAPPILHPSGNMPWKRMLVSARRAILRVRSAFAALHMALAADKMRRARRLLALHGIRHATHAGKRRPS